MLLCCVPPVLENLTDVINGKLFYSDTILQTDQMNFWCLDELCILTLLWHLKNFTSRLDGGAIIKGQNIHAMKCRNSTLPVQHFSFNET